MREHHTKTKGDLAAIKETMRDNIMNLGLGVMISMLGGNDQTVQSINACLGKTIKTVVVNPEGDGSLDFVFSDDSTLTVFDSGRSCCESRYMTCDDNLDDFVGDVLIGMEISEVSDVSRDEEDDDWYADYHEQQFLRVKTNKGTMTVCTHNEHNGYYGGFYLAARTSEILPDE